MKPSVCWTILACLIAGIILLILEWDIHQMEPGIVKSPPTYELTLYKGKDVEILAIEKKPTWSGGSVVWRDKFGQLQVFHGTFRLKEVKN